MSDATRELPRPTAGPLRHAPPRRALLLLASGLAACAVGAPPPPPELTLTSSYAPGSPLAGVDTAAAPHEFGADPAGALRVRARVFDIPGQPEPDLLPLAPSTRLNVTATGTSVLQSVSSQLVGARYGAGTAALARVEAMALDQVTTPAAGVTGTAVLLDKTTALLDVREPLPASQGHSLGIFVARGDTTAGPRLALAIRVFGPRRASADPFAVPASAPNLDHNLALLGIDLPVTGEPLVLALPSPFAGRQGRMTAIALQVEPITGSKEDRALVAACVRELQQAQAARLRGWRPWSSEEQRAERIRITLGHLGDPALGRHSLLSVAEETGSALAGDFALAADSHLLREYTTRVREQLAHAGPDLAADAVAWQLERSLLEVLLADSGDLEPVGTVGSLLMRHLGEAARSTDLLREQLRVCPGRAAFWQSVVEENLAALGSSSLAHVQHAHAWLSRRGVAVPGFDPGADLRTRRRSVRQFEDARTGAPSSRPESPGDR